MSGLGHLFTCLFASLPQRGKVGKGLLAVPVGRQIRVAALKAAAEKIAGANA